MPTNFHHECPKCGTVFNTTDQTAFEKVRAKCPVDDCGYEIPKEQRVPIHLMHLWSTKATGMDFRQANNNKVAAVVAMTQNQTIGFLHGVAFFTIMCSLSPEARDAAMQAIVMCNSLDMDFPSCSHTRPSWFDEVKTVEKKLIM